MKNINYIISGILALAVVILFVLQFSTKKEAKADDHVAASGTDVQGVLPIAYINTDSLLLNYNYAKDLNEALLRRQENARASMNEKGRQLEKEVGDFQRKVQNNAFLSQERAQQEQQRLMKKQQDLQELEQRLTNEILVEQQKMNEQLRDSINTFLKEYNKSKKYEMIFSNTMGDNILIANPIYDITDQVIELLNKQYVAKK